VGSRHRVTAVGETTSLADRKRRAGQRMIVGIPGPALDDETRKLLRLIQPAGFCLFARNVVEPAQVLDLNRELAATCDPRNPAIRTVDQEGGRVQRIREPAVRWPPMAAVGARFAAEVGRAIARELRAMAFDLNFAPCADVHSNPANPVIGDRSFGTDPREVARAVAAFVTASQEEGIIACAKHFPGHGDTATDSHKDLPVVEKEDRALREVELPPFAAAVKAGVGTVMTSHVVYPAWDESLPATLSPHIVPRLLRDELGFEGVVFSDDLEMKALAGRFPLEDQLRRASDASVDVLLACESPTLQLAVFECLVRLQEEDAGQERAAIDAVARVHALRERFYLRRPPPPPLTVLGRDLALADRIHERAAG
jgi:beta-N-acetylhexosaminidase